jgi:NAD(P)-dependent dehydrogenase (short-subunit alcohol dehydrogenase family)
MQAETSKTAVNIALKKFGQVNGVCGLAGIFGPCFTLDNSNIEQWTKGMQINVLSHINMVSGEPSDGDGRT